ncbi:hypothetical protein LO80_04265 [Candidatus Francisella endociliophora]|uniref:Sensor protein FixL n=1 Tax=Candidatus Francisella endociliophora TaxID=653937 RepID=A0A097ENW5_9GAMM|nr:EAL domain-containing protein [Francisella sp. FSC1006]AIT09258.1 hypothetical protein LO80_04265 [Francisella sp. FSC1006]
MVKPKSIDYFKALEAAIHSVVIIDDAGFILMVNNATCKLFGYESNELVGQNVKILMPPNISNKHDDYLADYRRTQKASIIGTGRKVEAMKKNGQKFKILLSVSEVKSDTETTFLGIIQDLSTQDILENKMHVALQALEFGMWELDLLTNKLIWDREMLSLYETEFKEFDSSYDFWLEKIHPEDRKAFDNEIKQSCQQKKSFGTIFRINTSDKTKFIQLFANYLQKGNNQSKKLVGVCWDVTEKVGLENYILRNSEIQNKYMKGKDLKKTFQEAIEHTLSFSNSKFGFITILDDRSELRKTFYLNSKDKKIQDTSIDPSTIPELLKKALYEGVIGKDNKAFKKSLKGLFEEDLDINNYIIVPIFGDDKKVVGCLGIINSNYYNMKKIADFLQLVVSSIGAIISSNEQYNEIERLANKDSLTNCYSRRFFENQLDKELSNYANSQESFAVLIMDIDNFKKINDLYGHKVGDKILKEFASRVYSKTRTKEKDILARLGGDEFVLLCKDTCVESIRKIAERIIETCEKPYIINNMNLNCTTCIGGAIYNTKDSHSSLMNHADYALYEAKKEKPSICIFDDDVRTRYIRSNNLNVLTNKILKEESFNIVYQPIIDIKNNNRCARIEALIRPQDHLNDLRIDQVIHLIEKNGFAERLNTIVFNKVFEDMQNIKDIKEELVVSINISPMVKNFPDYMLKLCDLIQQKKKEISDKIIIELEITESAFMKFSETDLGEAIKKLHKHNIRLAVDDFGVEYSSLNRVVAYDFDTLKIDKSLTDGLEKQNNIAVVSVFKALFDVAKQINLDIVVEGVETKQQLDKIHEFGGAFIQGFYFSRPQPLSEIFTKFLDN